MLHEKVGKHRTRTRDRSLSGGSKLTEQTLNMIEVSKFKVTRLRTLVPPKPEGQLNICRQVNSF